MLCGCAAASLQSWAPRSAREATPRRLERAIGRDGPGLSWSTAAVAHRSIGRQTAAIAVDIVPARIDDHGDGACACWHTAAWSRMNAPDLGIVAGDLDEER